MPTILAVERAQLRPLRALRLALGVAVPLVAGIASGHPDIGTMGSAGALGVGFGAFLGVYRTQAATMIAAAAAISLSLFVGSVAGHSAPMTVALVMLWSFGAGLLGVFGPLAYFVGLQAVLNLLLGSGLPLGEQDAATRALAALAGGVLQTLLAVGVWPLRRFTAERAALADAYGTLARYAQATIDAGAPPPPLAASGVYAALADPHPFANHAELSLFQRLLDEAEQIRVSLAAIGTPPALRPAGESADAVAALRSAAADVLGEIGRSVRAGRAPAGREDAWRIVETSRAIRISAARPVHVARLIGQLRAAWRIAKETPEPHGGAPIGSSRAGPASALGNAARALRAALTFRSAAFRHALRVAVTVAPAAAMGRAMAEPGGYWLPIAALLVLQPAFGDTVTRGLGMMSGTIAGAFVATLISSLLRPDHSTLAALIVLFAWLCFTMFRANYALFAACITAYVVFLVSFFGIPQPVAALNRVVFTVLGGSLALTAYALWPTWEARNVPGRLAALLEAQARYAAAVLETIIAPEAKNDRAVANARLEAQLARSNAEESVERMLGEPRRSGQALTPSAALGILAAARTFATAGLALDAARPASTCGPWPALRPLARGIEESLFRLAAALRSEEAAIHLPDLRALHARLADRLVENGSPLRQLALFETDFMVDSLDAIASLSDASKPFARI